MGSEGVALGVHLTSETVNKRNRDGGGLRRQLKWAFFFFLLFFTFRFFLHANLSLIEMTVPVETEFLPLLWRYW